MEQIRRICGGRGLCKYFTKSNRLRPLSAKNSLTLFLAVSLPQAGENVCI
ncbi:hypothetical protein HPS12939_0398 [Glaesserella parasuis 12939]|nr:hypothetical protein HPS12939_0398 [Glaesserella parasuis 12939]